MKIYVDSSWLLRVLLQQSRVKALPVNADIYSSMLLIVECRRTLDRHLKRSLIDEENYAALLRQLQQYLDSMTIIEVDAEIVMRAAEPFFLPIGSLDALHLATVLKLQKADKGRISVATFDDELALAAAAHDFHVIKE